MQDNPTSTARKVLGFKIESAIPIPRKYSDTGFGKLKQYPFDTLGVGESFFVPGVTKGLAGRANYWGKKLGWKFTARVMDGGTRFWRIA